MVLASASFRSTLFVRNKQSSLFHARRCAMAGAGVGLSSSPSSYVSPRRLSEELPSLGFLLALFTVGNLAHYFFWLRIWQSRFLCLGVACGVQRNGLFGRFCGNSCAMLGSTVNTCFASVRDASGRNAHSSYGEVNSNPEVFFFVLTQNGEVCSVDASGAWKSGILCTSCTWLAG